MEFYYPDDWIPNLKVPFALIALTIPQSLLKGKFNANLTVGTRNLSGVAQNKEWHSKFDVDNLKRLLTSQGVRKFKMKNIQEVKIAGKPARRLIYGGKTETYGMKFDMMWVNYTMHITNKNNNNSVEYMFTLTSEKKDHISLLKILEQIIETVSLINAD